MNDNLPFTHLSEIDKKVLVRLAADLPAGSRCLEIGSYLGASAILVAKNLPSGATLTCVDTWQNDGMSEGNRDTYAEFHANTKPYGNRITAVRQASAEAAKSFNGNIDFLFIDGDHSYEGCKSDFDAWAPRVKEGGLILFHDVAWAEGVQRVIREDFLPIQQGAGCIEGNIYYGHVGKWSDSRGQATAKVSASPAVISVKPSPPRGAEALYGSAKSSVPVLWVHAGMWATGLAEGHGLFRLVESGAPGLVAGRHKVLAESEADVLIYLDDDVTLPPGWRERILEPFENPEVHFVGCRYLPDYEHEPPPWMAGLWSESDGFRMLGHLSLLDGGTKSRFYDPCFVWGLCYAVRRETLIKLGGFNPDGYPWELRCFRGDGETAPSMRAKTLGLKAFYQGATHVLHKVPAGRMTPEYFERRSFLQGISDSFTQVRQDWGPQPEPAKHWKDWLRPIKRARQRAAILRHPTTEGVQHLMHVSHRAGYLFHQNEVRNDPKLLDWVLRPDYFDYSLPERR
jgi:hypothetical protein